MKDRSTITPEDLTAIVDTREQTPLDLSPLRVERAGLATGDYSLKGLEDHIAIERKSLPDLISCVGSERDRFEREIQRLKGYETRAVVVEASWSELLAGGWRSRVEPKAAVGSVLGWIGEGVPFLFVESHEQAGLTVARLLFIAARRRWRELQGLQQNLRLASGD